MIRSRLAKYKIAMEWGKTSSAGVKNSGQVRVIIEPGNIFPGCSWVCLFVAVSFSLRYNARWASVAVAAIRRSRIELKPVGLSRKAMCATVTGARGQAGHRLSPS